MATYKIAYPGEGWPSVTVTGTYATSTNVYPPLKFGQIVDAYDATFGRAQFIFVYGSNITAGNLCQITGASYGARVAGSGTLSAGPLGFAPAAMSATNVWGFLQIAGVFDSASHSAAAAAGAAIKMGTVAGAIDVQSASNDVYQIGGMYNAASNTASNAASIMLNNPWFKGY